MLLSLAMCGGIVFIKGAAFSLSGSQAIFADFIESLVQIPVIAFAAYALSYRHRPPDVNHMYGHGKIQFVSSAIEGSLVTSAAMYIWFDTAVSMIRGYELHDMTLAGGLALIAAMLNGLVGWHLIRTGKKLKSIILIADGQHILSDFVTTAATLTGAIAAYLTGWLWLDALAAALAGLYIITVGLRLVRQSLSGLLDEADIHVDSIVRSVLDEECNQNQWEYHALRHRTEGDRHWVDIHLVFPPKVSLNEAHDDASHLEEKIRDAFEENVIVTTHLEPEGKEHDDDLKQLYKEPLP